MTLTSGYLTSTAAKGTPSTSSISAADSGCRLLRMRMLLAMQKVLEEHTGTMIRRSGMESPSGTRRWRAIEHICYAFSVQTDGGMIARLMSSRHTNLRRDTPNTSSLTKQVMQTFLSRSYIATTPAVDDAVSVWSSASPKRKSYASRSFAPLPPQDLPLWLGVGRICNHAAPLPVTYTAPTPSDFLLLLV